MKQVAKFSLLSFFLSIYFLGVNAKIKLPAIFSDNMVLQQQADDPVWGWASPGEQITVQGNWTGSVPVKTITNSQGKWMVKIKTSAAGGPYTLTIHGNKIIILHNVMIGEVWVCSGQSNMEFPLTGWPGAPMIHSAEEIKAAQYPDIRLFTVARHIAFTPQDNCTGAWSECNPQTAKSFSATAYFFGRDIYRKLKIPIGLISTNWGGTVAEAWTSESALRKLGDFNNDLNTIDSIRPHLQQIKEENNLTIVL